ncbi:hypothetical protein [Rhizobium sp. BK377]|uniref:hypothetical protein n=1 Tax=Rhizobium sp. BK377 TaxID=2587058 RepID=UPI00161E2862|nr:hypothetical protein [Rhizobium sp. BK377]MBB3463055.1 hypothetical protein [Rhizobium sp. BK377]
MPQRKLLAKSMVSSKAEAQLRLTKSISCAPHAPPLENGQDHAQSFWVRQLAHLLVDQRQGLRLSSVRKQEPHERHKDRPWVPSVRLAKVKDDLIYQHI